ncbi:MAG: DUF4886 domain-containing protein [Clostridia bacterium]|nr:DUF4886 domain-containing protein [Clostridia bacterium]
MKRIATLFFSLLLLASTLLSSCAAKLNAPEEVPEESTEAISETVPAAKTEEVKIEQADPAGDSTLNVLIIGNSFSTGWPDELNGLMTEKDIRVNIFTVYYSGCTLTMHWNWLQNGRANYRLRHHIQGGGTSDNEPVSLDYCLKKRNWDVIALQHSYGACLKDDFNDEEFHERANELAKKFFDYLKDRFPKSRLVWHEEWAYNVEWERNGVKVGTLERQEMMYNNIRRHSVAVHEQNGVPVVPSGTAWQIARANPKIGDLTRDQYHDGDTQGGQYLNACVWFEFLTGQSCVGSSYRPSKLAISEEEVSILQNAAHKAVTESELK